MFHFPFGFHCLRIIRLLKMPKNNTTSGYYAVGQGRNTGVFNTWAECESNVKGFSNAKFQKFPTAAAAQSFVSQHQGSAGGNASAGSSATSSNQIEPKKSRLLANAERSIGSASPSSTVTNVPRQLKTASDLSGLSEEEKLHLIIKSTKRRHETGTQLLDTPPPKYATKRLRTDSPQTKGVESVNGEKVYLPFIVDSDDFVNVYTDGACLDNGRANPKAGVGVWFGDDHPLNVSKPVDGPPTNNTAEIQAARIAIEIAGKAGFSKLRINTDSAFLIQCVTSYMSKWKKNGWKLAAGGNVKNRVELEKLDQAQQNLVIQWTKVPAHSGVHGNEMADQLASEGAARYERFSF